MKVLTLQNKGKTTSGELPLHLLEPMCSAAGARVLSGIQPTGPSTDTPSTDTPQRHDMQHYMHINRPQGRSDDGAYNAVYHAAGGVSVLGVSVLGPVG